MQKETSEKELEEKRSRYSAVSIILRQMYGVRMTGMPGYTLFHDVVYKHLEDEDLTIDELVEWACKHFIFPITEEEAYDEIIQVITQNLPESENGDDDIIVLLPKALTEATMLYGKKIVFGNVAEAVRKRNFSVMIEQEIIAILYEIKRGRTIEEALEKIATRDTAEVAKAKRQEEKAKRKKELKNTILVAFSSEAELLEFADSIS